MSKKELLSKIEHLKDEIRILEASTLHRKAEAYNNIEKCGTDRYLSSAITICIKNINKNNNIIVKEVSIDDGLSVETIKCLKLDILRSYKNTVNHPLIHTYMGQDK